MTFAASAQTASGTPLSSLHDPSPKGYSSIEVLWPAGAPGAIGATEEDIPKIYCYPAAGDGPHSAVVVLPGGSYKNLVMEKEGAAEARWLNAHGMSAYVLQYRLTPRYRYPSPMLDGERAVRFVRSHAAAWKLRPDAIGVWGFSAGGHLAGFLATTDGTTSTSTGDAIDRASNHPDFAIISYGRLSLDPSIPGTFGIEALASPNASKELLDSLSPVLRVTARSSPSFLYANEFDVTVSALNSTAFFNALLLAGVPAELHVFERGSHGTGMGQNLPQTPELAIFPTLLEHWLQAHGWMGPDQPAP